MTEILRRSRLFLGSYVLLFVLLAIRFQTRWLVIACIVLATLGLIDMLRIVFWVTRRNTEAEPIRVAQVTDAGSDVAGYLATYLLPFLTVAEPTTRDAVSYVIFLLVTGLVYVRSEMAQINPTLYILGKRVVAVSTDKGWSGHLVATSPPHVGDVVHAASLNKAVRAQMKEQKLDVGRMIVKGKLVLEDGDVPVVLKLIDEKLYTGWHSDTAWDVGTRSKRAT